MSDDDLHPIDPREAVELYIDEREPEVSEKTLQNHQYRLDTFVDFCREQGIESLHELDARDPHRYRRWRQRTGDVSTLTLRSNLATLRVALEFWADLNFVEEGMRERVKLPEVAPEDQARDEMLTADRADDILDYLEDFHYASRAHVVFAILWHTGMRLGTLRAIDVDDVDLDEPCIEIRHRPESGTPLKNGTAAERAIALGGYYAEVIEDYIEHNRLPATDDHGRRPLISSREGRLSPSPIRRLVYEWTRPCEVGAECPHDRDPETCEAMEPRQASQCPSSKSPHGIRRGAITNHLRNDTPERVVSDRCNVSDDVLDRHYDQRTERERMEARKEHLPEV